MEEPGGKRQKHEKEHAEEMDEEGIDDVRDSDEEGEEDVNEESEETKVITERLAHANMLIEEAELSEFQDKERVAKAGEIFQSVIEISKDQIEGYPTVLFSLSSSVFFIFCFNSVLISFKFIN